MTRVVRLPPSGAKNGDERILPLINVVFLLLIFFMLAGRLSTPDPLAIEPPASASEALPPAPGIEVLAAADGRLALDGRVVTEADLLAAVRQRVAAAPSPDIRFRADGELAAAHAIGLMRGLQEAGVGTLYLVTVPAGR